MHMGSSGNRPGGSVVKSILSAIDVFDGSHVFDCVSKVDTGSTIVDYSSTVRLMGDDLSSWHSMI